MTTKIGKSLDLVDLDVGLNGRSFTVGWLLDSLRKNDDEFKKLHGRRNIQKVESVDISNGKGFISVVLRCTIHFLDSVDETDVYTTIMKIPGTESIDEVIEKSTADFEMRNDFMVKLIKFHKFECDFYEYLAPKLEIPVPKVYKTVPWIYKKAEGCLHMEDLTTRGKSMSFWETINISQIKDVVRHLAHMHKQLLIIDEKEWKGKFMENQRAFCEGNNQFERFHAPFLKFAKSNSSFMDEMFKKYYNLTKNPKFIEYINCFSYIDLELPSVLVHGDLHAGNIMWDINKHGDITNDVAAFVDWQIMHEGSPMSDIARILTLCADGSVRREAETFIVEYYHDFLTQELKSVGRENPYKLENLKKAYDICFFGQAFHLPVMVVFLEPSLPNSDDLKTVKDAKIDKVVLRAIHGWEDLDRKLSSEKYSYLHKFNEQ